MMMMLAPAAIFVCKEDIIIDFNIIFYYYTR